MKKWKKNSIMTRDMKVCVDITNLIWWSLMTIQCFDMKVMSYKVNFLSEKNSVKKID